MTDPENGFVEIVEDELLQSVDRTAKDTERVGQRDAAIVDIWGERSDRRSAWMARIHRLHVSDAQADGDRRA